MVDWDSYDYFVIRTLYRANRDWLSTLEAQQARIHDACMAGDGAAYIIDMSLYRTAFRAFALIIDQIETLTNDAALSQQKALMNRSEDVNRVRGEASALEDYLMGKELNKMGQGAKAPTFEVPRRHSYSNLARSASGDLQIAGRHYKPTTVECRAMHDVARVALETYCPRLRAKGHQLN